MRRRVKRAHQGGPQDPDKEGEEKAHGIAMLAQPEMASISPRIGFSQTTGHTAYEQKVTAGVARLALVCL
jgi:hypothetical protein